MMKCFERLVMHKIKTSLPNTLDPLQFAYHPNRSMDDAISSTLHLALTHLENKDSYVRMLFIVFSFVPPPKHPPNLTTPKKKLYETFFVQFEVCYTQVSGPVQTTCSNTLSSRFKIQDFYLSHTRLYREYITSSEM